MDNVLFLTASLDTYDKDENGNRIPHNFGNENAILDNFKKYIKKYDNFLFVASSFDTVMTDIYAKAIIKSFKLTLPFKHYDILDMRTKDKAEELVQNADFIFICGGHVPTQNKLFKELNLKKLLKKSNAVICGGSAGSMNSADIVYCPPELEGEAIDKNFKKYLKGLGLTNINIYPHVVPATFKGYTLDGVDMYNDALNDSKVRPFIMFDDGTYILQVDGKSKLFGTAYIFKDGKIKKITNKEIL